MITGRNHLRVRRLKGTCFSPAPGVKALLFGGESIFQVPGFYSKTCVHKDKQKFGEFLLGLTELSYTVKFWRSSGHRLERNSRDAPLTLFHRPFRFNPCLSNLRSRSRQDSQHHSQFFHLLKQSTNSTWLQISILHHRSPGKHYWTQAKWKLAFTKLLGAFPCPEAITSKTG